MIKYSAWTDTFQTAFGCASDFTGTIKKPCKTTYQIKSPTKTKFSTDVWVGRGKQVGAEVEYRLKFLCAAVA